MTAEAIRPWCAIAVYPGLKPFIGGTVVLSADTQSHEVEAALQAHFLTFLPPGFRIERPIAGALFFQSQDDT